MHPKTSLIVFYVSLCSCIRPILLIISPTVVEKKFRLGARTGSSLCQGHKSPKTVSTGTCSALELEQSDNAADGWRA